jgi:hypothetical protein
LQEGLLLRLGVRGLQGRVLYDRSFARTKLVDLPARPPDPDLNPPDSPGGGGGPRILPYGGKIGQAEEAYRTRKAAQLDDLRREYEEFHLPSEVEFEQQAPLCVYPTPYSLCRYFWSIGSSVETVRKHRVFEEGVQKRRRRNWQFEEDSHLSESNTLTNDRSF